MGNIFKLLDERKIKESPDNFARRMTIELCETIHLHYRNFRMELSSDEFMELYRAFKLGFKQFQEYILANAIVTSIKVDEIDPFDEAHRQKEDYFDCGEDQQDHIDGVALVKHFMESGETIRPIAVTWNEKKNTFVRMDGFKRYWAHKELGKESILCYVLKEYIAGIQEELPLRILKTGEMDAKT